MFVTSRRAVGAFVSLPWVVAVMTTLADRHGSLEESHQRLSQVLEHVEAVGHLSLSVLHDLSHVA